MSPIVTIAAPIAPQTVARITELEPRLDVRYEPDLLPPMRFPADFSGDPGFRRTAAQQARFDALIDACDILYGIPDVKPKALHRAVEANPRLRWVQTMAAGGGEQVKGAGPDREALDRIIFTTSSGVHGLPLAEFAVFGVLAGAKSLPRLLTQQKAGVWSGRWSMGQVADQTVLVLGLGGIGRAVARTLAALGAKVIGVSQDDVSVPWVDRIVAGEDVYEAAGTVDAIVSSLPGTATTTGYVGDKLLSHVKPGITVVNVGRGTVVDEAALLAALNDGRVGFAALDVFAIEPLPATSPLWTHPRVLVSPHTAALTDSEEVRIAELFAENARRFLDGHDLVNRVNTIDFY